MFKEIPGFDEEREIEADHNQIEQTMDEEAYRTRLRTFNDHIRAVEDAIGDFTVEDVIEVEADDFKAPLAEAKQKFTELRTGLRNFYSEFDRDDILTGKMSGRQN